MQPSKGLHYCSVLSNLAGLVGMAESVASTDLGEEGLQTAGNRLFATPIFFNVQPQHPPFHLTEGKREDGS